MHQPMAHHDDDDDGLANSGTYRKTIRYLLPWNSN